MKGLFLLSAVLLFGCAGAKTLEELELEAMKTGDWSAVERREKVLAERQAQRDAGCATGSKLLCETIGGASRCYCSPAHEKIKIY